ncbi:type 1 glycerol-3-phosphate oxidase [Dolosigranulum pigrum]|uniref:type 1 glycerol-3-phosphate oxidase n=1 Tax=Dolosigranulum pigrum TaxID=29394 RepID=UPI001AD88FA3|nr:type 1 glycerol-3-phosphate oxidase [Dolosigranulum pigrum]QTJ49675.1 type 1 glycerol-3-phosphate oxidase [Dolosigranulum pigrum]
MSLSYTNRQEILSHLKNNEFDILIIGGGITGAGLALQSAASGLETGLIEMQDFSEGTSSRSTKLVHGGIRYLKQFDVEVVNDTVGERAVVQQIAPHIPKPDPMLIPLYDEEGSTFDPFKLKVAMNLYDSLAGIDNTTLANYSLSKEETLKRVPGLMSEGLLGGGNYLDFNNSDVRLVIENIKKAHEDGGTMASRVKAVDYLYNEEGNICGVRAEDILTGEQFDIAAKVVVNASGPWSDKVRNLGREKEESFYQMRPTKGVHLVVDKERLTVPQPIYFDTGLGDGRMVFVIPREDKTYFGTTDTDYTGDYTTPKITQEDVDYLLDVVNRRFPDAHITLDDVESSWAGLRPLISGNAGSDYNGGDSGKISDESFDNLVETVKQFINHDSSRDEVEEAVRSVEGQTSERDPSAVSRGSKLDVGENGLVTIAGGKITDYRKMAESTLEKTIEILERDYDKFFHKINSKTYPVSGGQLDPENVDREIERLIQRGIEKGLSPEDAAYLSNLYGSNAPKVFSLIDEVEPVEGLETKYLLSLHYALRNEMVISPVDFLVRRTNLMLFMRDKVDEVKEPLFAVMKEALGWSDEQEQAYRDELQETLDINDLKYLR